MPEVSPVTGPIGPENRAGKKEQNVDPNKFKQTLKVEKVENIDPDETKKKRKRREDQEEEVETANAALPTPPGQVTPFSLAAEPGAMSPFEMQAQPGTTRAPSGGFGSAENPLPPPPFLPSAAPTDAFQDEMEDDEETSLDESENAPQSSPTTYTPQQPNVQPPPLSLNDPYALPQNEPLQQTMPLQSAPPSQENEKKSQKKGTSSKTSSPTVRSMETPTPFENKDATTLIKTLGEQGVPPKPVEKKPEEVATEENEEEMLTPLAPGAPTSGQGAGEDKEKKKKEESVEEISATGAAATAVFTQETAATTAATPVSPYARLSKEVMDLFDKMVGVVQILNEGNDRETTFTLNSPQFKASIFFGAQIIIKEYSTAPKAFNIQFNGSPEAVKAFEENSGALMVTFQQGNYGFRINRLETGQQRPLFKRKGKVSGEDNQDQTGEEPK